MLQSIPANENGFINSVNGKSYQEYNKWLKGALENSLQEGVIDGAKYMWLLWKKGNSPCSFRSGSNHI